MNEVKNEIDRLKGEMYQNEATQKALQLKQKQLNIEQKTAEKQARLDARRKTAITREKTLRAYEKVYPYCPHFLGQVKAFNHRWDAWVKAKEQPEILEYLEENELISDIGKQFKLCVGVLQGELGRNPLDFRSELYVWRKSVEKRLNKLEGK